jgi:glycosyltransferase involved in cell wall biosynthesis
MTRSRELLLKVGLFGLQDLRRLAPIGDIGYLNDISYYHDYERSGLIRDLMKAFYEQQRQIGQERAKLFSWRKTAENLQKLYQEVYRDIQK